MSTQSTREYPQSERDWKYVKVEIENGIAWVSLNRPEKRNAMNPPLNDEMVEILDALEVDESVGVVVLTGSGDSFSGGMDLKEYFRDLDDLPYAQQIRKRRSAWQWQWRMLLRYSKPTIAMVNGWCFGAAFTPLVACDLAIAAEDATFGLSEINWAMLPGGNVLQAVIATMNLRDAMYYVTTGDRSPAAKPWKWGWSTRLSRSRTSKIAPLHLPSSCSVRIRPCCVAPKPRCGRSSDLIGRHPTNT